MTRRYRLLAACLALAALGAACGKKGNPLPPLRPVPARIADLSAIRTDGQVVLRFTVPDVNLDGTTPVAIERVDLFAMVAAPDVPPIPSGQIVSNASNFLTSLPIRRPVPPGASAPSTPVSTLLPAPGEIATYIDRTDAAEKRGAAAIYYVAVPVAGTGRGRLGPPTPIANVPLGPLPVSPAQIELTHDEANVRVAWEPEAEGQAFKVYGVVAEAGAADRLLTPTPISANELDLPVEFGRETCVSVQAVRVAGPVIVEGATSKPACLTPVDRYPPAAPAGLRVVQDGAAVTLIWDPVSASDLAGYIVLRSNGSDGELVPLTQAPVRATTYRDTTVQAGATYAFAVSAIDTAPTPNVSPASAREVITVR